MYILQYTLPKSTKISDWHSWTYLEYRYLLPINDQFDPCGRSGYDKSFIPTVCYSVEYNRGINITLLETIFF